MDHWAVRAEGAGLVTRSDAAAIRDTGALFELVRIIADSKHLLGRRLSEWGVGAPTLESAVACMAIAQEELGHARGLYSMLEGVGAGPARAVGDGGPEPATTSGVSFVVDPSPSWYGAVAALVLLDGAMTVLLETARHSAADDLRHRAQRILGDEDFHSKYATGRVRELLANDAERALLEARLGEGLPEVLCWLGPPDDPLVRSLIKDGILDRDTSAMRRALLDRLAALSATTGLRLPPPPTGNGWGDGDLPWTKWNAGTRRLEGTTTKPPVPGAGRSASSGSVNTAPVF